jgi:hypothetical protein
MKALPHPVQAAPPLVTTRGWAAAFCPRGRQHPIGVALQRSVVRVTRSLKGGDQIVTARVEGVGSKNGGLPSQGHDFAANPFEVLAALLGVRENVHGISRRHGADLLEAAPRLYAGI